MPTHMIHLAVANTLNSKLISIKKLDQFYLGSISPDAVQIRRGMTGNDKAKSHLSHKEATLDKLSFEDIQFLQNHVVEFIQSRKAYNNYSFFLGYGVHILTDIHWSEVSLDFQQKYANDAEPLQTRKAAYYNDLDHFDFMMYQNTTWKDEVVLMLKNAQALDVDTILKASEIDEWRQCILTWFEGGRRYKNPAKYLTQHDIMDFINTAAREIFEILSDYK